MESLNISIPIPVILQAIDGLPVKEKYKLAEQLEEKLLSEFDEYDNSVEVQNKIELSLNEYKNGDYKTLAQLKKK